MLLSHLPPSILAGIVDLISAHSIYQLVYLVGDKLIRNNIINGGVTSIHINTFELRQPGLTFLSDFTRLQRLFINADRIHLTLNLYHLPSSLQELALFGPCSLWLAAKVPHGHRFHPSSVLFHDNGCSVFDFKHHFPSLSRLSLVCCTRLRQALFDPCIPLTKVRLPLLLAHCLPPCLKYLHASHFDALNPLLWTLIPHGLLISMAANLSGNRSWPGISSENLLDILQHAPHTRFASLVLQDHELIPPAVFTKEIAQNITLHLSRLNEDFLRLSEDFCKHLQLERRHEKSESRISAESSFGTAIQSHLITGSHMTNAEDMVYEDGCCVWNQLRAVSFVEPYRVMPNVHTWPQSLRSLNLQRNGDIGYDFAALPRRLTHLSSAHTLLPTEVESLPPTLTSLEIDSIKDIQSIQSLPTSLTSLVFSGRVYFCGTKIDLLPLRNLRTLRITKGSLPDIDETFFENLPPMLSRLSYHAICREEFLVNKHCGRHPSLVQMAFKRLLITSGSLFSYDYLQRHITSLALVDGYAIIERSSTKNSFQLHCTSCFSLPIGSTQIVFDSAPYVSPTSEMVKTTLPELKSLRLPTAENFFGWSMFHLPSLTHVSFSNDSAVVLPPTVTRVTLETTSGFGRNMLGPNILELEILKAQGVPDGLHRLQKLHTLSCLFNFSPSSESLALYFGTLPTSLTSLTLDLIPSIDTFMSSDFPPIFPSLTSIMGSLPNLTYLRLPTCCSTKELDLHLEISTSFSAASTAANSSSNLKLPSSETLSYKSPSVLSSTLVSFECSTVQVDSLPEFLPSSSDFAEASLDFNRLIIRRIQAKWPRLSLLPSIIEAVYPPQRYEKPLIPQIEYHLDRHLVKVLATSLAIQSHVTSITFGSGAKLWSKFGSCLPPTLTFLDVLFASGVGPATPNSLPRSITELHISAIDFISTSYKELPQGIQKLVLHNYKFCLRFAILLPPSLTHLTIGCYEMPENALSRLCTTTPNLTTLVLHGFAIRSKLESPSPSIKNLSFVDYSYHLLSRIKSWPAVENLSMIIEGKHEDLKSQYLHSQPPEVLFKAVKGAIFPI